MTTTTTKEAREVERTTKAILEREEAERRKRATEQAQKEIGQRRLADERAAAAEAAKQRLRSMDRGRLEAARERAHEALEQYAQEIDAWNAEIADLIEQTHDLDRNVTHSGHLEIDGEIGRRESVPRAFGTLALEIARAHQPHGFISLDNPH